MSRCRPPAATYLHIHLGGEANIEEERHTVVKKILANKIALLHFSECSSLTRILLARRMSWEVRWVSDWLLCAGSSFSGAGRSVPEGGLLASGRSAPPAAGVIWPSASVPASASDSISTTFIPFCAPSTRSSRGFSVNSRISWFKMWIANFSEAID